MSLDPELPIDPPESQIAESVALDAAAAQATDSHATVAGHHGPMHAHCENCGAKLQGPWCHACGQHDFEFHRSFLHVVMEALEAFLHFDSNFFRSTFALLFRPGWLTERFNAGKRAAQMPPFRLYLFVAFVFFLVMHFADHTGEGSGDGGTDKEGGLALTVNGVNMEAGAEVQRMIWKELTRGFPAENWSDAAKVNALFARMEKQGAQIDERIAAATPEGGALTPEQTRQIVLDTLAEDNAAHVAAGESGIPATGGVVGWDNQDEDIPAWVATIAGRLSDEQKRRLLLEKFFGSIPKVLLVCMPVFALLTRILFRKSRDFVYLKHLVLALHYHTFIYLWTLVINAMAWLVALPGWGLEVWVNIAGGLWMMVYMPWMLRRLFANGWPKTIVKSGLLAGAYGFVLVAAFATTGLLIFAL